MRGGLYRTRDQTGVAVCRRGHRLTRANTYNRAGGKNPQCRPCRALMRVKYRRARQRTKACEAYLVQLGTHNPNGEAVKKPVTADKCPRCSSTKVHGPRVVRFDQAPWCDCYSCGHAWQPQPVRQKHRR